MKCNFFQVVIIKNSDVSKIEQNYIRKNLKRLKKYSFRENYCCNEGKFYEYINETSENKIDFIIKDLIISGDQSNTNSNNYGYEK